MDKKQIVLDIIREKGPIIPAQIYKEIESDILIASAYLSELAQNKILKISHVKMGGSPFYYLAGQEGFLERYIKRLHEKEERAVLFLKEKKVLRDKILDPLFRVALRNAKDFAKPFYVKVKEEKELFWKWFLLNNNEEIREGVLKLLKNSDGDKLEGGKKKIKKINVSSKEIIKKRQADSIIQKLKENKIEIKKGNEKKKESEIKSSDKLLINLADKFKELKIKIIEKEIIRKKREAELIIKIPSAVGYLDYFCKVLKKQKINENDLSSAFVKGQMKKLPVMFISSGMLTKKAKEAVKKEFKGISVKRMEL